MHKKIVIIGAGPSGTVSGTLLQRKGHQVTLIEKQYFPRFVIGESLLSHCIDILEEADMLRAVENQPGFQYKNGAAFTWQDRYTSFEFNDKFTHGASATFQVQRAVFDQLLAKEAQRQGVEIRFGHEVTSWQRNGEQIMLGVTNDQGLHEILHADFVLDASGYGRVLPRLLHLEKTSPLPPRQAVFTHIDDHIVGDEFDRNKILISTHPQYRDVWYWLIPFSNGRCSIGVVGTKTRLGNIENGEEAGMLQQWVNEVPMLQRILKNAVWENDVPFRHICNYSANVSQLYGEGFALLGNAAEFLDPVFSSGVTIALHSAKLASKLVHQQLQGKSVDWQKQYADKLMLGINAFRTYVDGWYDGSFQDVIYAKSEHVNPEIKRMICAILAGYAWDDSNPYVTKSARRLKTLAEVCGST